VGLHQLCNVYIEVGIFMLVFFPVMLWYMGRTECLKCGKRLGRAAAAAVAPNHAVTECPHCKHPLMPQFPERTDE
jgi:hypothetical protein